MPEVKVKGNNDAPYKAETISSPKFTQPLVDTPQTITVIKKEVLQEQGAVSLSDALRNTPGITFLMGENGNTATGDSIFMRGFDTQGSIFVDGIRDLGTVTRDTYNIEQVEVVKGPAGADIGRGSPTGYINLVTKLPLAEDFSAGSVSVGSGVRGRATADLNRQLDLGVEGSAVRLNAMYQDGGVPGRDGVRKGGWGIAPSLALGLGTRTRTFLYYQHADQDNRPDGGIPTIGLQGFYSPTLASAGLDPRGPRKVDSSNYYGSLDDFENVEGDMVTARIEHDLRPGTTLRNTSRYGVLKQRYDLTSTNILSTASATAQAGLILVNPADPNSWTVQRNRQGKDQRNEILTNQTNLTTEFATGEVRHALSTGLEFIYEQQTNDTFTAAQSRANLYNPSTSDTFPPLVRNGEKTKGDTTTAAVYAFDTIKFGERWIFNGGVRVDHYRTETTVTNPTTAASNLSKSDNAWTWKVGALYKPAPNGSVYLAYATQEKPPGSDNFALNAGVPNATTGAVNINTPNLDPQKATNIELGTKWDVLDARMALTGAIFHTVVKNDLAQRDAVTGEVTQYGEKKVQGVEIGAVGQVTPAWQLSAGLVYLDTEVEQGQDTATNQQTGATINWSPKWMFTAWTTYRLPVGVTLGGGARYVDTQARQINNAPVSTTSMTEVPSYVVFDAMAAYDVTKNVQIQLNVYNLFDKFYLASLNNGGSRYTLGTPRSALLSANLKF